MQQAAMTTVGESNELERGAQGGVESDDEAHNVGRDTLRRSRTVDERRFRSRDYENADDDDDSHAKLRGCEIAKECFFLCVFFCFCVHILSIFFFFSLFFPLPFADYEPSS